MSNQDDEDRELHDDEDERSDARDSQRMEQDQAHDGESDRSRVKVGDDGGKEERGSEDADDEDARSDERDSERAALEEEADSHDDEDEDDEREEDDEDDDRREDDDDRDRASPVSAKEAPRSVARAAAPESSSGLMWLAVGAAVLLGGWWLLKGNDAGSAGAPGAQGQGATSPAPADSMLALTTTDPRTGEPVAAPTAVEKAEVAEATAAAEPAAAEASAEPAASPPSASAPPPEGEPSATPSTGGGGEFDRAAGLQAVAAAAKLAARCRRAGAPSGAARVSVVFAPSGVVDSVRVVNAPYAGTPTATCIREKLQSARMAAFSGQAQTVVSSVQVY